MKAINIREHPELKDTAIRYISDKWANEATVPVYDDCISRSIVTEKSKRTFGSLPIWYLLIDDDGSSENEIVGCAGLITNDFISCMDLCPWLCALYIEEKHRGNAYGSLLIEQIKKDAAKAGFDNVYLATDHIGYYEKYGFKYICDGYHPWGDSSRVYECAVQ